MVDTIRQLAFTPIAGNDVSVVEQSTRYSKFQGSNLATAGTGREEIYKKTLETSRWQNKNMFKNVQFVV